MLPIETFLKSHPGVTHLRICTDNDKAGREHAARLEEEYAARGYLVESCIPHGAKDYNELLQKGDRAVNVLNWLLVAAGLFMAFIGYACIVVGARSERDDWEERK